MTPEQISDLLRWMNCVQAAIELLTKDAKYPDHIILEHLNETLKDLYSKVARDI